MVDNFKKYFALSLIIIFGLFIIYLLRNYLTPIFAAIVLSFLTYPIYKRINHKIKRPNLSASIILIGILLLVLIPISAIAGIMLNQVNNMDFSKENIEKYELTLSELLGREISITEGIVSIQNKLKKEASSTLPKLLSITSNFLLSTFIMFFIIFYLLVERKRFLNLFTDLLPFSKQNSKTLIFESKKVIIAVLIGQVLTAIIQGLLGMFSFLIVGIEGAVFWGIIMILLSIIPMIGAFLIWLPAGLFLIFEGSIGSGIFVLLWGVIVVSQVDNLVRPKLVNKFANIHPLETFLGIFMGIAAFGMIGIILGPLILSLFNTLIRVFNQEYGTSDKL